MTTSQSPLFLCMHYIAVAGALLASVFVVNNFFTYIFDMPGLFGTFASIGIPIGDASGDYSAGKLAFGWLQTLSFAVAFIYPVILLRNHDISRDAKFLDGGASFIVAGAFWSVMLIGIVDATISFVRIEGFLPALVGDDLALSLGKPAFRGTYVHIPLLAIGFGIAMLRKGIDFIWLASLIVFGELLIVITRFIFSYEQAFMGDLVRFWYASLFLFASAYTLIHDGHVRVDVIYAGFSEKAKNITNMLGSLLLGLPLCWIVLFRGLWSESSPFNLALLNFEVTQQGFGMYVKYLMSGFLIIFALSMIFQFSSFILSEMNKLRSETSA